MLGNCSNVIHLPSGENSGSAGDLAVGGVGELSQLSTIGPDRVDVLAAPAARSALEHEQAAVRRPGGLEVEPAEVRDLADVSPVPPHDEDLHAARIRRRSAVEGDPPPIGRPVGVESVRESADVASVRAHGVDLVAARPVAGEQDPPVLPRIGSMGGRCDTRAREHRRHHDRGLDQRAATGVAISNGCFHLAYLPLENGDHDGCRGSAPSSGRPVATPSRGHCRRWLSG